MANRYQQYLTQRQQTDLDRFYRRMLAERRGDGNRRYSEGTCDDYRTYVAQAMTAGGLNGVPEATLRSIRSAVRKFCDLMGSIEIPDENDAFLDELGFTRATAPDDSYEAWKARRED